METKAPSSTVSEMSDNARWLCRPEVWNICETASISIMAAACAPDAAGCGFRWNFRAAMATPSSALLFPNSHRLGGDGAPIW